jgi:hypothetical protein
MRLPPHLLERWVGQIASRRRSDLDLAMKEFTPYRATTMFACFRESREF